MSHDQPGTPDKTHSEPPPSGWWAVWLKVIGMKPEDQRSLVALVLTALVAWLLVDMIQDGRNQRAADRLNEIERTAMMVRALESENEKNRQSMLTATDRTAQTINDSTRIMVGSHQKLAAELAKLEQQVANMSSTTSKLEQRLLELTSIINELKKKLPPSEIYLAPPPRVKLVTVTTASQM